jgi:hypothetical protein
MSGALIDLVAKGVQDAYLTGQPEVSFFRQNYKRHTNFAMKTIRLNPMGNNTDHTIKIPTKGDLLNYVWIDLGDTATAGAAAINADSTNSATFELWIGGQMIDRQDAFYMVQLWHKFLLDSGAKGMASQNDTEDATVRNQILNTNWVPLHFFFCDNYSLPLLCLQYNEVEIRITYKASTNVTDFKYYASYTVLDTDERDWFVNNTHELLIEQVQKLDSEGSGTSKKFDLNLLNHPVKCLMWSNTSTAANFTSSDVMIYLNGTELFGTPLPDKFFTQVQGYYHSEHASELLKGGSGAGGSGLKMYSFAMKANKHQPTGTCNFSRLDNAHMTLTSSSSDNLNLYAVNFNILRIKQGMAGLAFSN